ncbi:MAG TPA: sigma-70 family RNA polymerase sigma factor [Gemmataceae bacterium]|nr:sigma-70 family RNA polymerase sigma factor [Gemmataceae bacterium]
MAGPTLGTYLHRLKQAMAAEALADCTDRELVERLRSGRDDGAFRAVLDRHGPMVYQVCGRVLSSQADVEDAFQATFLVLFRRGNVIRRQASLASWLHGVARRTALKLRTQSDRRRRRERTHHADSPRLTDDATWGELRDILDEELRRLPDACRASLVLCYLEGRTQDEAAARLDVSKSTLRRNLERGRVLLGRRLARRGIALGAALAARLVSDCAQGAAVPRALVMRTVESASHTASGLAAPAGVISARVAALSDGVTKAMQYAKYKVIVAVLAGCLGLGIGVNELGPKTAAAQDKAPARESARATGPDIEPIDPNLVFDPGVRKQLRLSPNQVRRLAEARDKGTEAAADQGKRVAEIDQRIKALQEEIDRLQKDRDTAHQAVHKAQTEQVRAAIPNVLSRDAVQELRQLTLQNMRLSDVLLDAKIRSRLELNDEQVKKIQEIAEKGNVAFWLTARTEPVATRVFFSRYVLETDTLRANVEADAFGNASRSDLLKVLTPAQRTALERMSGVSFDKPK